MAGLPARLAIHLATLGRGLRAAVKPGLMFAGLLGAGLLLRHLGLHERLPAAGEAGVLFFLVLATAACAVGVPRQIAAYAGGVAFGFPAGTALALAAMVLACALDLLWARLLARDWVAARLRGRLARLDAALAGQPFLSALTLRLLPVGNNLALNLLAGVSSVAPTPFILGSAVGYAPQTIVFALLGSAGRTVDQGTSLALGAGLFLLLTVLGGVLYRRVRASSALLALPPGD